VGQLLSTSKMLLGITQMNLGKQAPDTLHTAHATLGDAIQELRHLSKSLDREWIQQFSFHHNLQQLVDRINAGKRISVTYEAVTQPNLPHDQQIVLFRIVQEAIQNAIRHAQPSTIAIKSATEDDALHIIIADNGRGITNTQSPAGMGISNMQYRTGLLGGTIQWTTQADGTGTVVQLLLPLNSTTA
jgi:signal transduction histidine kinase